MRLPQDRNDRVMLGVLTAFVGVGLAVGLSNVTINAPAAAGATTPVRAANYKAQPARGEVPHAHTMTKIVRTNDPISIVRNPTDLPPPIGKRGPQRVKVELETVEVTGHLADGATYRYWTFNQKIGRAHV